MAKKSFAPSAPNATLWLLALILGIAGILLHFVYVAELSKYSYWMLLSGFVLLLIGTTYRGV